MMLSTFMLNHTEEILVEWESFARTLQPAAVLMTSEALRDHAQGIIKAIAADIECYQSDAEQVEKSHGDGEKKFPQSAAAIHGTLRELSGFSLIQLTAEFRALRASVLRLWLPRVKEFNEAVHEQLMRFNEAVDQALAESAATYSEHTNHTRERFLAILGHDLRTPLSAISMTGALLERTATGTHAVLGKRLQRSATTMSSMVNDLLEYSRTQLGGKMPMVPTRGDMADVYLAALHDAAAAQPECVFDSEIDGDTTGAFDAVRMQQVMTNLLSNAAQYRAIGTSIASSLKSDGDTLVFAVRNLGPAIPVEQLPVIFNAMVQLPVDDEQQGRPRTSMGLGLFIARESTLAHHGSIEVTSTEAEGTVFTVRIPREPAAPATPPVPSSPA
ncbi:MAG: HAMP domain-containing histidine kinase [Bdellovibrionales bacterium]|nr:HAMP domain-containing histidine kinase [Ramlibacter sp.]